MSVRSGSVLVSFALASCDAPYVQIADTSVDAEEAAVDTAAPPYFPDATATVDGRVCSGHEEDGDGIPDDCDNCPGVHDATQTPSADSVGIGSVCAPKMDGISFRRKLFDPVWDLGKQWLTSSSAGFHATSTDDLLGGDTTGEIGFATLVPSFSTMAPLVVTSSFQIAGCLGGGPQHQGVFVRGSFGEQFFVGCGIYGNHVVVVAPANATGCAGATCDLQEIGTAMTFPSSIVSPSLRAIALDKPDGGGHIQCIVTDPANPLVPETIAEADVPSSVWGVERDGYELKRVGLFAQRCKMLVHWFEVMTGAPK